MTGQLLAGIAPLLIIILAAPATAGPAPHTSRGHWGEEQALRVDLGAFRPDGESSYWEDKAIDFTGDAEDFEDAAVAIGYVRFLGPRLGLAVSGSFYEPLSETQEYLFFEDERGFPIYHVTDLETYSLTLGFLFHLARRDAAIVPYLGIGGGVYFWRLTEVGDFIDFSTPSLEIFFDFFEDEGSTLGYYYQAGLEVPVARNWSVYAEGRWQKAEDDLGGDFEGLGEIDLSGRTIAAGVSWSF
jgi:opacity protein-like surface antigen